MWCISVRTSCPAFLPYLRPEDLRLELLRRDPRADDERLRDDDDFFRLDFLLEDFFRLDDFLRPDDFLVAILHNLLFLSQTHPPDTKVVQDSFSVQSSAFSVQNEFTAKTPRAQRNSFLLVLFLFAFFASLR